MIRADKLAPIAPPKTPSSDDATSDTPGNDYPRIGVLVCIVSSGVDRTAAALSSSSAGISGCVDEHPLDPGGCPFAWDKDATGQGTHLASIVAGSAPSDGGGDERQAVGVIPGAEIYSVRVWNSSKSSSNAPGDGAFATSRLLAYTACEGRLRGLQASNYGRSNYRMVMLMDMQASTEGPSQLEDGAPRRELYPSRAPDLLAPGINITGASPAPAQVATLSLAGRGSLQLLVASPGSAAGKNAFPVTLATCARNGTCPKPAGSVRQLCVLQLAYGDIRSSMCTALGENTGCRAGLVVAALEGERDFNGWQAEVAQNVDGCWSSYGSSSAGVKTPVLMATAAQGANLKAAAAAVGSARGSLAVSPALHRTRSGTPQAAASRNPAFDRFPDPEEVVYATFRWPVQLGGEDVRVSGSWDSWASQTSLMPVAADGQQVLSARGDAVRTLLVPRGVHDYKFIVDGKWRPAPADPVARDQAGATNNKRLFTGTGVIAFKGRRDMEVLVMGDWSDWTDAQRMLWNERTQQWECPMALPPGEYSYVLHYRDQYKLDPNGETGPADVLGRTRHINRLFVAPPCAFTLFYATGWPRCSLVYRIIEGPDAPEPEWREVPFDGAPSRSGPRGDRWMQAIIEAPGPNAQLQFYAKGPRPDINDEWGPSSSRRDGAWGGSGNEGARRGRGAINSDDGADGVAEDRPATGGAGGGPGHYTLPWPSGWKLERGAVSKFLRALRGPIMLCSDVDGTFVTDKQGDEWGNTRIKDFKTYWEDTASLGGSVLVLNTGRSKGNLMSLLRDKEEVIAVPDVIITAVGTKIWHRRSTHRAFGGCTAEDYEEDLAWTQRLDHGWDLGAARQVAEEHMAKYNKGQDTRASWLDNGTEHPHRIALSVRVDIVADIVRDMEAAVGRSSDGKRGFKGHIIASGAGEWRYLDVVAERGGKLEAIEWGTSPAVIVGNAQTELLTWYNQYRDDPPGRIVLARAPDASGVIEGLARHGLL
ncbi:hypothetical protein MNEG_2702 [Monoraphidium neglectum]|uniref:AMP-activated protein kinase glycogen-binding domain-containing protein n=1 Tax=Monoraphidium neglectum TaxID=145388 RepID=A0A0D2K4A6_9CHLO|nr:hypothetical protein MNEG_2702 [Monoraphidium neglectum]KIZ05253.1 hypothetical protein MNEG_2702 [Monoraphidium neglectum]|eukprot:XP_013904272.1 hypothetical protein MNEG_2702 [Monoraphidium neglectum]